MSLLAEVKAPILEAKRDSPTVQEKETFSDKSCMIIKLGSVEDIAEHLTNLIFS